MNNHYSFAALNALAGTDAEPSVTDRDTLKIDSERQKRSGLSG
jgi:hypothetical protein